MPRVKFSTLVSAMAGKSNGSVFSKNQGGSYFRTNKSGYGLKTVAQQQNQAKFRAIGRKWSELTDGQREAWNSAVASFPTKNIFGDDRIPTGYELFCRINGVLVTKNMPLFLAPVIPQSIPAISSLAWNTPDEFLFQQQYAIGFLGSNSTANKLEIGFNDNTPTGLSSSFKSAHLNISFASPKKLEDLIGQGVKWGVYSAGGTAYYEVSIAKNLGEMDCIIVKYVCSTGIYEGEFLLDGQESKSFSIDVSNLSTSMIWDVQVDVNGESLYLTQSTENDNYSTFTVADVKYVQESKEFNSLFNINQISFYPNALSSDEIALIGSGYVYEDVSFIVQNLEFNTTPLVPYGLIGNFANGVVKLDNAIASADEVLTDSEASYTPLMTLDISSESAADFDIILCSSPPVSSGRSFSTTGVIDVASLPYFDSGSVDISTAMLDKWLFWTSGADFNVAIKLFDKTSGVIYQPVQATKPNKKPRFKAGSELSGKISKNS